jgi:hypothetical protein
VYVPSVKNELETVWQEAVMAETEILSRKFLDGLRKATQTLSE